MVIMADWGYMQNMEHPIHTSTKLLVIILQMIVYYSTVVCTPTFVDFPSSNVSTSWINNPSSTKGTWRFSDSTSFRPILAVGKNGYPDFAFGYFTNGTSTNSSYYYYLVILKLPNRVDLSTFTNYSSPSVILWSANGDNPVQENAILELKGDELFLKDVDGNLVWSANPSWPSITSLKLDSDGNLKLINASSGLIWQSFDNPTDTWLPGMSLVMHERVASATSRYNLARGLFYFRPFINGAIRGFVGRWPGELQQYRNIFEFKKTRRYDFGIGSFHLSGNYVTYQSHTHDFQYIRLEPNGHLNVFRFTDGFKESLYVDLFTSPIFGDCVYPTVCGKYGVCSNNSSCKCAGSKHDNLENISDNRFFKPLNVSQENLGCLEVNPLRCHDSRFHTFLELHNVTYFKFNASEYSNVNAEQCKAECLRNCSCKAVIFRYKDDISIGGCFLPHEIYSFIHTGSSRINLDYNAITFIKVQIPTPEGREKKSSSKLPLALLIPSILAGIVFLVFVSACCFLLIRRPFEKMKKLLNDQASCVLAASLVRKFGYDDLKVATQDFVVKLGEGGYGSVFQGTLSDGTTKIAVKQLNNQRTSDFEAEVKTIGRVHHVNLVKLIGYCDEVSRKLLVYEYVLNGSLDKWIFDKERAQTMGWEIRREIIIGIAKGLEYLHVHCNPPIIHFDIKPQNILLDGDFTVKIADFGLAKWTNKDKIDTTIRPKGTPGYMAPELLRSINVSLLVDVYSFGVVVLEIICGRRHSDQLNDGFLIEVVKRKAIQGSLYDLIDDCNEDMINHRDEVVRTMELAICCLQPYLGRPSVFTIVKILEGYLDLNPLNDYSFLGTFQVQQESSKERHSTLPIDSLLSGPR